MHDALAGWLRASAGRIHEQASALTALDQAIGDGDHGINLDRGFTAIVAMLDGRPAPPPDATDAAAAADLLRQAGKTLISTVGGASGPLYGTAFLRAAGAIAGGQPSSAAAFVAALEAAAGGIAALGKASEGEKTMLDALAGSSRPSSPPRTRRPGSVRLRPSRCSRPRAEPPISGSGASGTRIPGRPRRRCSSASWSRSLRRRAE